MSAFMLDNRPLEESSDGQIAVGSGAGGAPTGSGVVERVCPTCGESYDGDDLYCRADGARLRRRSALDCGRSGEVIDGRYTIVGPLGEGAMGTVYRAVQRGLEREVAIKILKGIPGNERTHARRFLREVRAISRLNHRNIVTVHDFGETEGGELYLAMELLRGATLRQFMDGEAPVSQERAVELAGQICDALQAAHVKNIIHRDLKPTNVVVVSADEVNPQHIKLLDFGLVKLSDFEGADAAITRTGHICGTPLYMSPEQALGLELDARSDIYAIGLLVYEMLTGAAPFNERPIVDILRAHVQEDPPNFATANPEVHVHPALEAAVFQALSKDVGERPDSAADFKRALELALQTARLNAAAETASVSAALPPIPRQTTEPVLPPPQSGRRQSSERSSSEDKPFDLSGSPAAQSAEGPAPSTAPASTAPATATPPATQRAVRRQSSESGSSEDKPYDVASASSSSSAPAGLVRTGATPPEDGAPGGAGRRGALPSLSSVTLAVHSRAQERCPQPPARGAVMRRRTERIGTTNGASPSLSRPTERFGSLAARRPTGRPPSAEAAVDRVDPRPRLKRGTETRGAARSDVDDVRGSYGAARGVGPVSSSNAALSTLEQQVAAAERLLDVVGTGPRRPWCELNLAELLRRQGRNGEAERHAQTALQFLKNTGNARLQGLAAELLVDIAEAARNAALASDWADIAIDSWRLAGNDTRLAMMLARRGGMLFRRRMFGQARASLEEAVELDRKLGDDARLAADLRGLGAVAEAAGEQEDAERLFLESLGLEERCGNPVGQGWCSHHLGRIAEAKERWSDAHRWHEKALAARRQGNDDAATATTLQRLAVLLAREDCFSEAQVRLREALAIHENRGNEQAAALSLRLLGDIARRLGDWRTAAENYSQSEAILVRIGSSHAGARTGFVESFRSDRTEDAMHRTLDRMKR